MILGEETTIIEITRKNTLFEILSLKYISYFLVFKKCFVFKPNNMLNKVML